MATYKLPSPSDADGSSAKQHRTSTVLHHHSVHYKQYVPSEGQIESEAVQTMMKRSLALALKHVGFDGADPVAMESFCAEVDECKL
jgi:hypothetical protein